MSYCSKPGRSGANPSPGISAYGVLALLLCVVLAGTTQADEISAAAAMESPDNPLFLLSTSRGNIYIEMLPEEAPQNTANIMALAQGEIELTDEANDFTFPPRHTGFRHSNRLTGLPFTRCARCHTG